jgi:2'-5' RNA ligase
MTAVIVRVRLPPGLERVRRRGVVDAAYGIPAHITLLYPFVDPGALDPTVRKRLVDVAAAHRPIAFSLTAIADWPDTTYLVVEPADPFARLQADLQAAFPAHPIYGRADPAFEFVPHVTLAEGDPSRPERLIPPRAALALPVSRRAGHLEVITTSGSPSRTIWQLALGRGAGRTSARYDFGP